MYSYFGGLPEPVIAFLISDILSALAFLHDGDACGHGIVCIHNDIKCSNILISENCETKLSDFGVACLVKKGKINI